MINTLFDIKSEKEFENICFDIFKYQADSNDTYKSYLKGLKTSIEDVKTIEEIPFLPIDFFKSHKVISVKDSSIFEIFTSSGTTSSKQSKHYVSNISAYEKSYLSAFNYFYGNIQDYCILALLPSYLERDGSSLIYMTNDLIKKSNHPNSGFYLNNYDELLNAIEKLNATKQKTLLIGVTYALLDLAEIINSKNIDASIFKSVTIMETGGMKGKREEMIKEEMHSILKKAFNKTEIHSEYGMTELLTQAYSKGNGIFSCPPWMKVLVRDMNDPKSFLPTNRTGGINVIDLANINSCSFIATQDLGKLHSNGSFEILGRFDNSDIRGCNLLVE